MKKFLLSLLFSVLGIILILIIFFWIFTSNKANGYYYVYVDYTKSVEDIIAEGEYYKVDKYLTNTYSKYYQNRGPETQRKSKVILMEFFRFPDIYNKERYYQKYEIEEMLHELGFRPATPKEFLAFLAKYHDLRFKKGILIAEIGSYSFRVYEEYLMPIILLNVDDDRNWHLRAWDSFLPEYMYFAAVDTSSIL